MMVDQKQTTSDSVLSDGLADIDIPDVLRVSVDRHRANLSRLLATMKSAGMTEAQIEASAAAVVESYKTELLVAIKQLMRDGHV